MIRRDIIYITTLLPKRIACMATLLQLCVLSAKAQLFGDFPYQQSFTSGVQPPETTLPTGTGANDATFTTDGLRLTRAVNHLFGAVFINNRQFTSDNGIIISFDYAIYGGTGADGISVFLFDAAITNPVVGSRGGGLGYTYNRGNNSFPGLRRAGLAGAYLGIGLDVFGNYKARRWQSDSRVNGVLPPSGGWGNGGNHVTLRGAKGAHIDDNGRSEGFTGYPVLATKTTFATGTSNGSASLNPLTGSYSYGGGTSANFSLRSGSLPTGPSDPNYRRAIIELFPNPDAQIGGFIVTVKIQHGATTTTVIDRYIYRSNPLFPQVSTFNYVENANPLVTDFNTSNVQGANSTHALNTNVPQFLRVGFAASTGAVNDIHLIRNLTIVLPYGAEAVDDEGQVCAGRTTFIDALANDIAYQGPISLNPTGSLDNIDPQTFTFYDDNGDVTADSYNYSNDGGRWFFNKTSRQVVFTSKGDFSGTASVRYSVKGSNGLVQAPYGDEAYRSLPATIRVDVKQCHGITNPMLPSGHK